MNINDYQKDIASAIRQIPKHPTRFNVEPHLMVLDFTNAIAGEAGELANVGKKIYRKRQGYRKEKYADINYEHLKEEFADVLSNCFEMAIAMGWSVEEILLNKLEEKQANGKEEENK